MYLSDGRNKSSVHFRLGKGRRGVLNKALVSFISVKPYTAFPFAVKSGVEDRGKECYEEVRL